MNSADNTTYYILLGTALAVVFCLYLQGAAYRNGCTDGYGYAREPWNPGYRRAGEYLREAMVHRWPELRMVPPDPMSGTEAVSDFFDARPLENPQADFDTADMSNVAEERRTR